jgi:hypothetical protein
VNYLVKLYIRVKGLLRIIRHALLKCCQLQSVYYPLENLYIKSPNLLLHKLRCGQNLF